MCHWGPLSHSPEPPTVSGSEQSPQTAVRVLGGQQPSQTTCFRSSDCCILRALTYIYIFRRIAVAFSLLLSSLQMHTLTLLPGPPPSPTKQESLLEPVSSQRPLPLNREGILRGRLSQNNGPEVIWDITLSPQLPGASLPFSGFQGSRFKAKTPKPPCNSRS